MVKRLFWGSLLLILIGCSLGWVYRANWMSNSIEVEPAQIGTIDHFVPVKAVFANEEYVIQAPASGKVEFLGKEGQRFRRGESVALIHPDGASPGTNAGQQSTYVSIPIGGLFFPKVDGLESVLTPQTLQEMDLAKILEQQGSLQDQSDLVQAGAPLGKVVNNLTPTVAFVEVKPTEDLSVGKTIKFNLKGEVESAKILRKSDNPPGLIVRFNQYLEGTVSERIQEVNWVERPSASGVIIPKSSLFTKGEEQGVYVVQEGIFQFRKVKVLDENDTLVCVEKSKEGDKTEGLPQGIPVIKNPRTGIEGLTAKVKILS
jgi:putative membrane fusion protein